MPAKKEAVKKVSKWNRLVKKVFKQYPNKEFSEKIQIAKKLHNAK